MAPSTVLFNAQLAQQNLDYYFGVFILPYSYILKWLYRGTLTECTACTAKCRLLVWGVHTTEEVYPEWLHQRSFQMHSLHSKI